MLQLWTAMQALRLTHPKDPRSRPKTITGPSPRQIRRPFAGAEPFPIMVRRPFMYMARPKETEFSIGIRRSKTRMRPILPRSEDQSFIDRVDCFCLDPKIRVCSARSAMSAQIRRSLFPEPGRLRPRMSEDVRFLGQAALSANVRRHLFSQPVRHRLSRSEDLDLFYRCGVPRSDPKIWAFSATLPAELQAEAFCPWTSKPESVSPANPTIHKRRPKPSPTPFACLAGRSQ